MQKKQMNLEGYLPNSLQSSEERKRKEKEKKSRYTAHWYPPQEAFRLSLRSTLTNPTMAKGSFYLHNDTHSNKINLVKQGSTTALKASVALGSSLLLLIYFLNVYLWFCSFLLYWEGKGSREGWSDQILILLRSLRPRSEGTRTSSNCTLCRKWKAQVRGQLPTGAPPQARPASGSTLESCSVPRL